MLMILGAGHIYPWGADADMPKDPTVPSRIVARNGSSIYSLCRAH
jgi:hypothetical protein